jgi:CDP-glucose 4,6-dehydratase
VEGLVMDYTFWNQRRVLVTGAAGFIGTSLVRALASAGAFVVGLVRNSDPSRELLREADLRRGVILTGGVDDFWSVERALSTHEVDTVFHLAAQSLVGVANRFPLQTFESNVRGTYTLLEACRIHSNLVERIVIASSDKAYGPQEDLPYREDQPLEGRTPYEVSKSCADLIAQAYFHTYGLPVAIARCGNVYGGGDLNWSRVIPGTIRSCVRRERPIVRSDGQFVRDYVYIQDVVQAYVTVAEQLGRPEVRGEAFNFSVGTPLSVLQVIDAIQEAMACRDLPPDIRNSATGEIRTQCLSAEKARRVLDWSPRYPLDEGLQETIAWYRRFLA